MAFELIVLLFIAVSSVLSQTTEPSNSNCTESCDCPKSQLQEFFGSLPEPPKGKFLYSGFLTNVSPSQVSTFLAKLNAIDSFVGDVELPDKERRVYRNCARGSTTYNQYFVLPLSYPQELTYVCGSRAECNIVVIDLRSRELLLLKSYSSKGWLKPNRCMEKFGIKVKFTPVWKADTGETRKPQKLIPRLTEHMVNPTYPPEKNGGNKQLNPNSAMKIYLATIVFISSVV